MEALCYRLFASSQVARVHRRDSHHGALVASATCCAERFRKPDTESRHGGYKPEMSLKSTVLLLSLSHIASLSPQEHYAMSLNSAFAGLRRKVAQQLFSAGHMSSGAPFAGATSLCVISVFSRGAGRGRVWVGESLWAWKRYAISRFPRPPYPLFECMFPDVCRPLLFSPSCYSHILSGCRHSRVAGHIYRPVWFCLITGGLRACIGVVRITGLSSPRPLAALGAAANLTPRVGTVATSQKCLSIDRSFTIALSHR